MLQDRIGTALMLIAAAWMASLAFTDPGSHAEPEWRRLVLVTAIGMLIVAFFPRHLNLSGTVLAFTMLGISLNIGIFGLLGLTWEGLIPTALLLIAVLLRRTRLDSDAVVVITAATACVLGFLQPNVILFALTVILVVSLVIWLVNAFRSFRHGGRRARS